MLAGEESFTVEMDKEGSIWWVRCPRPAAASHSVPQHTSSSSAVLIHAASQREASRAARGHAVYKSAEHAMPCGRRRLQACSQPTCAEAAADMPHMCACM